MAGPSGGIEWYIARDGAQHGPLSDVEMRKFVELGHLKPTDLVWRAGFPDWRQGGQVFPELAAAQRQTPRPTAMEQPQVNGGPYGAAYSAAPAAQPEPRAAAAVNGTAHPMAGGSGGIGAAAAPAQLSSVQAGMAGNNAAGEQRFRGPASFSVDGPSYAPNGHSSLPAAGPGGGSALGHAGGQSMVPAARQSPLGYIPGRGRPGSLQTRFENNREPESAMQNAAAGHPGTLVSLDHHERDDEEEPPRARRSFARTGLAAASVLILVGAGWIVWHNRSMLPGVTSLGGAVLSRLTSSMPAEAYQAPPFMAPGTTEQDIDASLQKTALWRVLKRDFAAWYGERVGEIVRMREQQADDKKVSQYLADVVVVHRRKNANAALSASPDHLKRLATAFVANLKQLASRDAQTCFGFISRGEASEYMVELSRTPAFADPLQRQLAAIFESIADGQKSPRSYPATSRADYDYLTKELTARGWTQDDLVTFSDPRRLASAPPDTVCRMVQDWFTVQLAVKDQDLQSRLLAESLKPLVHG